MRCDEACAHAEVRCIPRSRFCPAGSGDQSVHRSAYLSRASGRSYSAEKHLHTLQPGSPEARLEPAQSGGATLLQGSGFRGGFEDGLRTRQPACGQRPALVQRSFSVGTHRHLHSTSTCTGCRRAALRHNWSPVRWGRPEAMDCRHALRLCSAQACRGRAAAHWGRSNVQVPHRAIPWVLSSTQALQAGLCMAAPAGLLS